LSGCLSSLNHQGCCAHDQTHWNQAVFYIQTYNGGFYIQIPVPCVNDKIARISAVESTGFSPLKLCHSLSSLSKNMCLSLYWTRTLQTIALSTLSCLTRRPEARGLLLAVVNAEVFSIICLISAVLYCGQLSAVPETLTGEIETHSSSRCESCTMRAWANGLSTVSPG
jgi:hypothetical protein